MHLGAVEGDVPKEVVCSHMASYRPSKKPTVKDPNACPAKDATGGAANASADGDQRRCCMGANVSFSKGDVVQVSWGKANKWTKYDATVLAAHISSIC